ncbi:YbeU/YbeR family protein [Halomonas sp. Bachu 37]|uniref:DUF1266 domain-containing protein n=1 Tax=Halomonas kashgarensis TaxID=3084920 RepID=UPI0032177D18
MVDPLNAWWAQQLVLCDWDFTPDPLQVEPAAARLRLTQLGIDSRGELGRHLLYSLSTADEAQALLSMLELTALAGAAGWLSESRGRAWAEHVARRVTSRYADINAWLSALKHARNNRGWLNGDDDFDLACQALAALEQEEVGITWPLLNTWLEQQEAGHRSGSRSEQTGLWPDAPDQRCWRLSAVFQPIVEYPARPEDWPDATGWLHQAWEIQGRDELIRVLLWLASQGERQRWDIEARTLLGLTPEQQIEWLEETREEPYAPELLAFVRVGEPLEWAAWDWLRLVELAWAGACCGWLSQSEADHFAAHAADLITRRYHDWYAVLQAYQRGRRLFDGQAVPSVDSEERMLLQASHSPWQQVPDFLLDEAVSDASRRAMRAWRSDPRHWLLALAGVREPDLMQRQGVIPMAVAETRRADAGQYLQDTLGLHADEGVEALRRYWLPAQAHHLNQLAADAAHGALPLARTPLGEPSPDDLRQRNGLKGVSRHSATIHMAEKFAFYLQMAIDSDMFDGVAMQELVAALRDCLCRFYPDARRLLEAWAAWESRLPDVEQPPLGQEIQWHLEDPGSIFHWLDWRSGDWQEPGARPSLSHFTSMSLVGPLNSAVWSEPQPESERECVAIREWVDGHYGLHCARDLEDFLAFMFEAGDRQEYLINYAPYTLNRSRLESEIAILETGDCSEEDRHHLLRLRRVRDNEDGCNDVDMAAWDIAQLMDLAIAGRQLGWLGADEFARYLERTYTLAARHYAGWQDYALGMYAGFSFFMGETPEREAFLAGFRQALIAWLTGAPALAGAWASLDFPGAKPRHFAPLHIDTLPGDQRTLH